MAAAASAPGTAAAAAAVSAPAAAMEGAEAEARPAADVAAVSAAYPGARLLSEREQLSAHAALERRCAEVVGAMEDSTLGGEAGRALLNDAQRELVTISRLMKALSRRYIVVTHADGLAARADRCLHLRDGRW